MENTATHVSSLLKVLSHRDRLMVLCHLVQGEMAAGEIAEALGRKGPATSQQLSILRREGIIEARRVGQSLLYRIVDEDAVAVMAFLYQRFCSDDVQGRPDVAPKPQEVSA